MPCGRSRTAFTPGSAPRPTEVETGGESVGHRLLARYRYGRGRFGRRAGVRLFVRETAAEWRTAMANRWLPARYECPCCGWRGRRFPDYVQLDRRASLANEECPSCLSHSRHRAFAIWVGQDFGLTQRRGVALLFGPEPSLQRIWDAAEGLSVYALDVRAKPGVSVVAVLEELPVRSGSVDLLWCHHVLEHVEDDRAAMRELRRVLSPDGELIVSVPMGPGATVEYGFATAADNDHRRRYGDDFAARLSEAGIDAELVEFSLASGAQGLHRIRPEPFYRCRPQPAGREPRPV